MSGFYSKNLRSKSTVSIGFNFNYALSIYKSFLKTITKVISDSFFEIFNMSSTVNRHWFLVNEVIFSRNIQLV